MKVAWPIMVGHQYPWSCFDLQNYKNMKENFNWKALYRTVGHDDNISKEWGISNSFTNKSELINFPLNFNNNDDYNIIPEQLTVKAHPALFEGGGGWGKRVRNTLFQSTFTFTLKTPKPFKLWSRISQKRYEIERKCQWKLDRKSCMGFRMVKISLIWSDL